MGTKRAGILMLATLALVAACAEPEPTPLPEPKLGPRVIFDCDDGQLLSASFEADLAVVHLVDGPRVLPRVRAASGARYYDGTVSFWMDGGEVMLEAPGIQTRCRFRP